MRERTLGPRVRLSGLRPLVVVGDVVVIGLLLGLGMVRHGVNPLVQRVHAVAVVAPFLLGWIVAAPLVGAYADDAFGSARAALVAVGGAWTIAAAIGASLRSTRFLYGNAPPEFVAVVLGVGLVGVGLWRVVAATVVD